MEILRTADERFSNLPGYPFKPHYLEADGQRIHYVDEGPPSAAPVLMLHGEPSWSYLYRKMIPVFVSAGLRAVAPDLVGFGRSDKPANRQDYTYERHVNWITRFIQKLDLPGITLVCQDWGGLIGLRVAAEHPERFARIVAANTGLPTGEGPIGDAFMAWRKFSQETPTFPVGQIVQGGCANALRSRSCRRIRCALSRRALQGWCAPIPYSRSYRTRRSRGAGKSQGLGSPPTVGEAISDCLQRWRSGHERRRPVAPVSDPGSSQSASCDDKGSGSFSAGR